MKLREEIVYIKIIDTKKKKSITKLNTLFYIANDAIQFCNSNLDLIFAYVTFLCTQIQ